MLIPRYSIRTYFLATVLLAVFSVVLGYAIDGQDWARGITVAVIGAAGTFAVYALFFAMAWIFVESRSAFSNPQPQSPFAGDKPPKQVMPPIET